MSGAPDAPAVLRMPGPSEASDLLALAVLPFEVLDALGLAAHYERSFKLRPSHLLAQRYLLGVPMEGRTPAHLVEAACRMHMPQDMRAAFEQALHGASTALYGFEGGPEGAVFKAYAEYRSRLGPALSAARRAGGHAAGGVAMFRGFKWRADVRHRGAGVQTDYTARPGLGPLQLREAVDAFFGHRGAGLHVASPVFRAAKEGAVLHSSGVDDQWGGSLLRDVVRAILDRALAARPGGAALWLDLGEAGYPVRAFDLNLYDAGLRVQDIAGEVARLARAFGVNDGLTSRLMGAAGGALLGHVSAGRGRDGQPYLTVYFEP